MAISPPHSPKIQRHAGDNKRHDKQRLQRLRKDRSAQQEQTDAAEDDRGRDPAFVRSFEVGLFDSQYDQAEYGEEVECVAGYTVKGRQGSKVADDYVDHCHRRVQDHGVGWGVEEPGVVGY